MPLIITYVQKRCRVAAFAEVSHYDFDQLGLTNRHLNKRPHNHVMRFK